MKPEKAYGERRMRAAAADPKGQSPPADLELEKSVLGDLLNQQSGAESFAVIKDIVTASDFFNPLNRLLFECVAELYEVKASNARIGVIGVVEVAHWVRLRKTDLAGGESLRELDDHERATLVSTAKLGTLFDDFASIQVREKRVEQRAKRLRALGDMRRAIERLWTTAAIGYSGDVEMFQSEMQSIARLSTEFCAPKVADSAPLIEPMRAVFHEYLGVQAARPLLTTGFPDLDPHVALDPETLFVVGARSGRGKSSFAMQLAIHAGHRYGPALFISTEMPAKQLALRAACTIARVDSSKVRRGSVNQDDTNRLMDSVKIVESSFTWVCDKTGLDISDVCAIAHREHRRLMRETNRRPSILVVDYLQRIRAGRIAGYGANREQQVSAMALAFKELARELKLCVVLPTQLNADGDKRDNERPRASDLRESKGIENEADYVLLLHNPEYNERQERNDPDHLEACEFIVDKNRHGSKVSVPVWFQPRYTRFDSMNEEAKRAIWDKPAKASPRRMRGAA